MTLLLRCFAAWCRCWGLCSTSQRSSRTTGKRLFAVCLNFCRVLFFGHMSNALFAVCLIENTRQIKYTRQTAISPCADHRHTANNHFRRVLRPRHTAKPKHTHGMCSRRQAPSLGLTDVNVCRVPREAHDEHHPLPCAPSLAHGKKQPLTCATLEHTANLIKMF